MSKKYSETEILTYSIPLATKNNKEILSTLFVAKKAENYYLRKLFKKETIESLKKSSLPAYKSLEPKIKNKKLYIPSRINRGILEITGRILRQHQDRESLFLALFECEKDPKKWDFSLLKEKKNLYKKSMYIENIKEQTENFKKNSGKLPLDYFEMTKTPRLKRGIISYAPDDGQALRISFHKESLSLEMKVAKTAFPKKVQDWKWISFEIPLPSLCQGKEFVSPDLRCGNLHGKLVPILDMKVEVEKEETGRFVTSDNHKGETGNFIVIDWGIRKLITICVFNRDGEQISPPFFLKSSPLQRKLFHLRKEIDALKSKRDKLNIECTLWRWYNKEIAKKWNKFRQIQKQLSHLASNVILEVAKIFSCDSIYVEWLKSLKSGSFSKDTNWKINSTLRGAIFEKVEYKASLAGIEFKKPLPAGYTSQFCPKCGKRGKQVVAADKVLEESKGGGWFYCPSCKYNADRDYVACQNLARRALHGNKLSGQSKTFAYTTKVISDKLFRQSIENFSKLRHCLNGWKDSVFLRPVIERAGTLRL